MDEKQSGTCVRGGVGDGRGHRFNKRGHWFDRLVFSLRI